MSQATYYIIRALVALVAIPFLEAGHAVHDLCRGGLGKARVHRSPEL